MSYANGWKFEQALSPNHYSFISQGDSIPKKALQGLSLSTNWPLQFLPAKIDES